MSKITESLHLIKAGARTNKYRVLYPIPQINSQLDITCNASKMPSQEVGTVEVHLKGRPFRLAGDYNDEGTWEITIYNTPDHFLRRYFIELLNAIQSFDTPSYLLDSGEFTSSELRSIRVSASYGGIIGGISSTLKDIDRAITDIKRLSRKIENISGVKVLSSYKNSPWYMQDIIVQQLNHNNEPITQVKLLNAFVSNVGPVDYSDDTGDISKTTITFTFSGMIYQDTGAPLY